MEVWSSQGAYIGVNGLIYITVAIICIGTSWWALQVFKFDLFIKDPKGVQARALQIILSVVIGYQLAKFILDYAQWSSLLKWML